MRYQSQCFKIKLKPDSLERVREWARTLHETRRAEALETLRDESVIVEAFFLDSTPAGNFLIAFMKAESLDKSRRAFEASAHDIDRYHQQFKEDTWESGQQFELLVDLDRTGEVADSSSMENDE